MCRRGINPLRLLVVPWSDADHTLLAGLELPRVGKEGVGGWPEYRDTIGCAVKGESGDGRTRDCALSADCAEMPKPTYAEGSLCGLSIVLDRTFSFVCAV